MSSGRDAGSHDRHSFLPWQGLLLPACFFLLSALSMGEGARASGASPAWAASDANPLGHLAGSRTGSRASAKQVGAVMAVLALFQDAGALPPEDSPDANRLIKALIQFQSAFMKSEDPAVRQFFREALLTAPGDQAEAAAESFRHDGWTSRSLEALADYAASHPLRDRPDVLAGLEPYHVGAKDFDLLAETFFSARSQLTAQGRDLHRVYEGRRREMPGGSH
ncbi:MAG: hypothetical protein FJ246_09740 [Nitrospira sp.]|nr:hypothetical protein [Nitrospira sp.]